MNFGHIFSAIDITTLSPNSYQAVLMDAWVRVRFGADMVGKHADRTELGRKLMLQSDFMVELSGLTDDHFVLFPTDQIKNSKEWLESHLQWMIVAKRDHVILSLILTAVNDALGLAHQKSTIPKIDLKRLSRDLAYGLSDPKERPLTMALLTGELHLVRSNLGGLKPHSQKLIARRVREMCIIWALLDLQIIASRYFHAEWNALEAGGYNNPDLVTHATVESITKSFIESARQLHDAFCKGLDARALNAKLIRFLREHGLRAHAVRNGVSLGFTAEEMKTGVIAPQRREALAGYIAHVRAEAEMLAATYAEKSVTLKPLRIDYANSARKTGKSIYGQSHFDDHKEIRERMTRNLTATSERYSMSTLLGVTYALERVISALATLPINDVTMLNLESMDARAPSLFPQKAQIQLKRTLHAVYRHLFTRDSRHAVKMTDATYLSNADPVAPGILIRTATRKNRAWAKELGVYLNPDFVFEELHLNADYDRIPSQTYQNVRLLVRFRDEGHEDQREREFQDRLHDTSLVRRLTNSKGGPSAGILKVVPNLSEGGVDT